LLLGRILVILAVLITTIVLFLFTPFFVFISVLFIVVVLRLFLALLLFFPIRCIAQFIIFPLTLAVEITPIVSYVIGLCLLLVKPLIALLTNRLLPLLLILLVRELFLPILNWRPIFKSLLSLIILLKIPAIRETMLFIRLGQMMLALPIFEAFAQG
jgi:hypothetical protein